MEGTKEKILRMERRHMGKGGQRKGGRGRWNEGGKMEEEAVEEMLRVA